jgi:hypothetical protein
VRDVRDDACFCVLEAAGHEVVEGGRLTAPRGGIGEEGGVAAAAVIGDKIGDGESSWKRRILPPAAGLPEAVSRTWVLIFSIL